MNAKSLECKLLFYCLVKHKNMLKDFYHLFHNFSYILILDYESTIYSGKKKENDRARERERERERMYIDRRNPK